MGNDFISYLGSINSSFIHSNGKKASSILIKELNCKDNENILEVGFGTASTLSLLAKKYKKTTFYGIETSSEMYKQGVKRISFCGLKSNVKLFKGDINDIVPLKDVLFDKIYIESVLAIQEGNKLKELLLVVKNKLKPSGILILNETIWIKSISIIEIEKINNEVKLACGIIQSNAKYPYIENWIGLFNELGYEIGFIKQLDSFNMKGMNVKQQINLFSDAFTYFGKIKKNLKKDLIKEKRFFNKMKFFKDDKKYMEGYLIKLNI